MVTRALGDHEKLSRTKLASHTNIRFRTPHRTCTVYIENFISSQKGIRVESHTRRYSLSSHHHLGTQILQSGHDHSLSGPPPTTKANLLCRQSKAKSACLLRKCPKQMSSYAGSHAAACRPCSARNSRPKLT